MAIYRLFAVFAFKDESSMNLFKRTRDADLIADRKLARMLSGDALGDIDVIDVAELFDEVYACYLIYELKDDIGEKKYSNKEDAS